jgi:hypothetical protein
MSNGTDPLRKWEVGFAGVVAAFAVVLAIVSTAQWCAMLKANRSTRIAADAAKESADAAIAASRAWIVPIQQTQGQKAAASINLYWKNAGKSPAVHISGTAEYLTPFPGKFRAGCGQLGKTGWKAQESMTLPEDTFSITLQNVPSDWKPPPNSVITTKSKVGMLGIHGCVWYTDVLSSRERTTEFCYMADRIVPPIPENAPEVTIFPCLSPRDAFIFR